MKMPDRMESIMFAPCGMNCTVCYKHCCHKKPCDGCLGIDAGKPEHCKKCDIKACVREMGHTYCFECVDFPCKKIKSLEKSYKIRYKTSLIKNSQDVKVIGLELFMKKQQEDYTCSDCGGVVSLHDAFCSECGKAVRSEKNGNNYP